MVCPKCHAQIPDNAIYCPACGTKQTQPSGFARQINEQVSPQQAKGPAVRQTSAGAAVAAPRKKKTTLVILIAAGVLAVALAVLLLTGGTSEQRRLYRQANQLMSDGSYAAAQQIYEDLGDYRKSTALAEQCAEEGVYAEAVALMDSEDPNDLESARELFSSIPGFRDADALGSECLQRVDYISACSFLDSGSYEAALASFESLGDYSDSAEKAAECRNYLSYEEAMADYERGDYDAAKALFLSLGDFSDAADYALKCDDGAVYDRAVALFDAGSYDEAKEVFSSISDFKDAGQYIGWCGCAQAYDQAAELIAAGKYADAQTLLAEPARLGFKDASTLLSQCKAQAEHASTYSQAQTYYNSGNYYKAYKLFKSLGSYQDSAAMMSSCVRSAPGTGEVYHASGYSSSAVSLKINAPSNSGYLFIKMYNSSGVLVSTVFFRPGGSTTVYLPTGTYTINAGYGGTWYGAKDAFGEYGDYSTLLNGSASSFQLSAGSWELTMSVSSGGNVGNKDKSWGGF